jgi:hypothetical protein
MVSRDVSTWKLEQLLGGTVDFKLPAMLVRLWMVDHGGFQHDTNKGKLGPYEAGGHVLGIMRARLDVTTRAFIGGGECRLQQCSA